MSSVYPPVSFSYLVSFNGIVSRTIDTQFQSVSGLSVEMVTQTQREGGENRYEHVLPEKARYTNLTLKRGLVEDSALLEWCSDAFEFMDIQPVSLDIMLWNENNNPLISWHVNHAWPKKWSVSDLDAEKSAIAVETLVLHYRSFSINS